MGDMTPDPESGPRPVLLYDADCGFCTRSAHLLGRLGARCQVRPLSGAALAEHRLNAHRARFEVPFVHSDGHSDWGAAAIAEALRTCRTPWGPLGALLATPPLQAVARPAYRWVSAHRHRLPGGTPDCRL